MVTDNELLDRIVQKDVEALAELYDRYAVAVYSLAMRILSDTGRAEDVVQDVFLNVWRSGILYKPGLGTVRSWLLAMSHHRAVDIKRKLCRESPMDTEIDDTRHQTSSASVSDEVEHKLLQQDIQGVLGLLPEDQQEVIILAYFKGYTQREIAELKNIPLGTVKGRIRIAMEKLRTILNQRGVCSGYE